ncbi:unnamed protein product [Hyaloperonospora brassicae]|uniref:mRNA export factor GLE1 n=1 Tax=Hyaloperonospora brassicae TaxID=162125 RepID=A0AAV0SZI9_HYABA|nr:unnamed protein product [Hyaloperonospora brassicae]
MRFSVTDVAPTARSNAVRACYDGRETLPLSLDSSVRRRSLRPPDCFDSSATLDDENDDDETVGAKQTATGLFQDVCTASMGLETVQRTSASRQELVKQLERACERRAAQAVAGSDAYQTLCQTLQQARQDADVALERLLIGQSKSEEQDLDVLRQELHRLQESRARVTLQQMWMREKSAIESVEHKLHAYQQAQRAEAIQREKERKEREEADEQWRQEELQKAKEEEEAQQQKERELQEQHAKAKLQAAERAAAQKRQEIERKNDEAAKKAADKEVAARMAEHVEQGRERMKRLEDLRRHTAEVLDSPDPSVKKIRMQIRREAGVCNQIAAAPSAIKNVVSKIQQLLQMAKTSGDAYFKFALDMVASNLSRQVESRADYKSCYPVAHVIKMSCVQTPELTDVVLGYFHKTCVFTIPDNPEKHASQTIADYKMSVGFHKAVGESSDPDGLEHVTEYTRRMTMVCAVLAAVRQTTPWDGSPSPPGLGLGDCWSWLARLLNEPPHLMTGALTLTILEVAGFELLQQYKKQFHKLLVLIARDVCPRLSKNAKTGAANAAGQLEMFVNQYHANRCRLNEPDGRKLEETKISEADEERSDRNDNGGGGGGYHGNGGGYHGGGRGGGGRGGGRGRGSGRRR